MKLRASWLIALAVVVVMLAVPSLREQLTVLLSVRSYYADWWGLSEQQDTQGSWFLHHQDPGALYRARAADFVAARAPNDPELLLGAGLLIGDGETATDLLRKAAGVGNAPAAWAAYTQQLIDALPQFASAAEVGGDPADPQAIANAEEYVQQKQAERVPDRLQPQDVAEAMQALHMWEKVDPQNALPLALEARCFAATMRMDRALLRWEAASRLPKLDEFEQEHARAMARVLIRMGMPGPEAVLYGSTAVRMPNLASLRQIARVAQYEGGLARMHGHDAEALRWYHASIGVGRTLMNTGSSKIAYLVGNAIGSIGAAPAWRWYPAEAAGQPRENGVLLGGLIFYGPYHDWYVKQVGPEADARLRDRLVQSKVRASLMREDDSDFTAFLRQRLGWAPPLVLALTSLAAAWLYLLLFLGFGSWRRRDADAATTLRPSAYVPVATVAFAPLAAALLYAVARGEVFGASESQTLQALAVGSIVTFAAAIFLPLIAAGPSRVTGFGLLTTWRGNLRRVLPVLVALCMLCYLGLSLDTARQRRAYVDQWMRSGFKEMADLRQRLGQAWDHPVAPAGAVRAEYPVLKDQGQVVPPSQGHLGGSSPARRNPRP